MNSRTSDESKLVSSISRFNRETLLFGFLLVILTGCANPLICMLGCVTPQPPQQYKYLPINTTHIVHKIIVLEDDTPPLQKAQYFTHMLKMLADWTDAAIIPGEDGIDIFVGAITHKSIQNDLLAFHVRPIPPDKPMPVLQVCPTEAQDGETPTHFSDRAAACEQANTKAIADWQAFLKTNHELLTQVRAQVKQYTDAMRNNIKPIIDPISEDIYGALSDASSHFSHFSSADGEKILIMASPLRNNTNVDYTRNINLRGVAVRVTFFTCDTSSECDSTKAFWSQQLLSFGASSVTYYSPQDTIVDNPI
jgi:hypothetical protein